MEILMFLLCGVLGSVSGQFFHESSGVTLKPTGGLATSDFGFSMAYQDRGSSARLVVGAPRQDYVGKVYSCPLSNLSSKNCSMIDMTSLNIEESTAVARKEKNPETKFFFGASVVATPDYFFTCAPLLTKTIKIKRKMIRKDFSETFGECYVNYYATSGYSKWIDSAARLEDKNEELPKYSSKISFEEEDITGGALGWNTLVDESFLIAAKSGLLTDILYTNAEHPLANASMSLLEDNQIIEFDHYLNLGYGLAAGNFFNQSEKLYAVSLKTADFSGMILFLRKKTYNNKDSRGYHLDMVREKHSHLAYIGDDEYEVDTQSSMFGYAMAAVDMNRDGLSELLVGAPAQTEDGRRELGALHVFVGGDLVSRKDKKRRRTVLADKANGRFGSAIATSDIDGDSLPEIFVSAPYEDYGVVYALSGYELKQVFFKEDGFKLVQLSDLALTQALRGDGGLQLFGFSLQVVKDVDENGCNELAIGAPDSSSVKLVRCLPAVNTTLTLNLLGNSTVALNAKSFVVEVCLNVTINKKCKSFSGNIAVESFSTGYTNISVPRFSYKIKADKEPYCKNITVDLKKVAEQTDYTFTTKLSMSNDDPNPRAYKSWAVFSAYSEKEMSITVPRYCTDPNCVPNLSYKIFWSGNSSIDLTKPEARNEMLTFELTNTNSMAYSVVLELEIRGVLTLVRSGECAINKNIIDINNDVKAYTCTLMKMLDKGDSYNMSIPIYLPAPTNSPGLEISAKLYDAVFPTETFKDKPLFIPYKLEADDVTVNGSSNSFNVTDKDLEKGGILFVASSRILQEFIISNDGPVTWYGILAILKIKNKYIKNIMVVTRSEHEKWVQQYDPNDNSTFIYHNRMTLKPKSKKIIEVSISLFEDKIESDVTKGDLSIISELGFNLNPLSEIREGKSSTQIIYAQILTVGNNKSMIILIVVILAVLLLLILMFVLYKHGFFNRDDKKKLSVLRENISKQNVGMASENNRSVRPSVAEEDHCDIEVYDDCPFHEVEIAPSTTRSTISLIETSPEEHNS